jgi:hypothetical protein
MDNYPELVKQRIYTMMQNDYFMNTLPLLHGCDDLKMFFELLGMTDELHIISARYETVHDATMRALNTTFARDFFDSITLTETDKFNTIQRLGIDCMIDDCPAVICACQNNAIDTIMISNDQTPYNWHLRGYTYWQRSLLEDR